MSVSLSFLLTLNFRFRYKYEYWDRCVYLIASADSVVLLPRHFSARTRHDCHPLPAALYVRPFLRPRNSRSSSPIEIRKEITLPSFFFEHLLQKTSNYKYLIFSEMYVNPFEDEIGLLSVLGPGMSFSRTRESSLGNVNMGGARASVS